MLRSRRRKRADSSQNCWTPHELKSKGGSRRRVHAKIEEEASDNGYDDKGWNGAALQSKGRHAIYCAQAEPQGIEFCDGRSKISSADCDACHR